MNRTTKYRNNRNKTQYKISCIEIEVGLPKDDQKNELKPSDEQFSILKKLFLKRQKELKNG